MGRRGELARRLRYARAEWTPGLERRRRARARFDARYGPCTGVPGEWCPVHGQHESDTPGDDSWSRNDVITFVVGAAALLAVGIPAMVWSWPVWVGIPAILLTGLLVPRVTDRLLPADRGVRYFMRDKNGRLRFRGRPDRDDRGGPR